MSSGSARFYQRGFLGFLKLLVQQTPSHQAKLCENRSVVCLTIALTEKFMLVKGTTMPLLRLPVNFCLTHFHITSDVEFASDNDHGLASFILTTKVGRFFAFQTIHVIINFFSSVICFMNG